MSNLSEEEIIEEMEKELRLAKNIDDVATTIRNEYIQGLLDLYNKEKEKNQELQYKLELEKIDNKYNQEERDEETIPKYKIREFIKEETKEGTYNFKTISAKRLKELLEEE